METVHKGEITMSRKYIAALFCCLSILLLWASYVLLGTQEWDLTKNRRFRFPFESYVYDIVSNHTITNTTSTPTAKPFTTIQRDYIPNGKFYPVEVISSRTTPGLYAVISACTPLDKNYNYVFYLPLTVLAWEKIGFHTIVIIIGKRDIWTYSPTLNVILEGLLDLSCTIVFMDAEKDNYVMLSQTSRLFVSNIIDFDDDAQTYVVTSDADIWPLNRDFAMLPANKSIVSTHAFCCGNFRHRDQIYRMLPMTYIGMNASTWKEAINLKGQGRWPARTAPGILKYFQDELGVVATWPVQKGENEGWYLDQHMISIRIEEWVHGVGHRDKVAYVGRDPGMDRLDRTYNWRGGTRIRGKFDAHLLSNIYKPSEWIRTEPLMDNVFKKERFEWAKLYHDRFTRSLPFE